MSNQELSKQLMRRVIGNLGIGYQVGLMDSQNILRKKLRLEEEDGAVNEYAVWGAECFYSDSIMYGVCANIGTVKDPDYVAAIVQEEVVIALRYSLKEHDPGLFLIKSDQKWVDMSVQQQLNFTSAVEFLTQNGFIWTPTSNHEKLFGIIASVLSEDTE